LRFLTSEVALYPHPAVAMLDTRGVVAVFLSPSPSYSFSLSLIVGNGGLGDDVVARSRTITEMCSGSEAGSYLRLIDFCITPTLGLRVIKNNKLDQ